MLLLDRRTFLASGLPGLNTFGVLAPVHTEAEAATRAESPRIGTDPILTSTGVTARWQADMKQDLGWAARFEPMRTREVLRALEQGSIDAGIFLSHPRAEKLDQDGLIYDRQTLARTDVLLLGPQNDVAGIQGEMDGTRAIRQVLAACRAGVATWHPLEPDSPLDALAHRLSGGQLNASLSQAASLQTEHSLPTYRLMTRAQWHQIRSHKTAGKVWVSGARDLALEAQIACSFHARHPGAKLLVKWLQWPLAQRALRGSHSGWHAIKV